MSDHPKEAERNLKKIDLSDGIYHDLFRSLPPKKVGLALAVVSHRFNALVDTHFDDERKWSLGKFRVGSNGIVKRSADSDDGRSQNLPFPQTALPGGVIGFCRITVECQSLSDGIAFLRRIGRLLESDISLELCIWKEEEERVNDFVASIWPLLNLSAIAKMDICQIPFRHFRRRTSPSILCECTNLRMIVFNPFRLQFPPDDSDGSSDGQALCQWLHTPLADGRPKVLKIWDNGFPMDALKTAFLNATAPVSFIIRLISESLVRPFELDNLTTREQLATGKRIQLGVSRCMLLIKRSPIDGKRAEQWAEWEREAKEREDRQNDWKVLGFC